jgi:hypothetical protein
MLVQTNSRAGLIRLDVSVGKGRVVGVYKEVAVERTLRVLDVINPAM